MKEQALQRISSSEPHLALRMWVREVKSHQHHSWEQRRDTEFIASKNDLTLNLQYQYRIRHLIQPNIKDDLDKSF